MGDLIKRQDAIDAIIADKIEDGLPVITDMQERDFEVFNSSCDRHAKILKELPSAQTGWTGIEDDYPVSVKAVLNITAETGALETQRKVRELPSAQKTGKWYEDEEVGLCRCDQCQAVNLIHTPFCPMCGARMECEEE